MVTGLSNFGKMGKITQNVHNVFERGVAKLGHDSSNKDKHLEDKKTSTMRSETVTGTMRSETATMRSETVTMHTFTVNAKAATLQLPTLPTHFEGDVEDTRTEEEGSMVINRVGTLTEHSHGREQTMQYMDYDAAPDLNEDEDMVTGGTTYSFAGDMMRDEGGKSKFQYVPMKDLNLIFELLQQLNRAIPFSVVC